MSAGQNAIPFIATTIVSNLDVGQLANNFLLPSGKLKLVSATEYDNFSHDEIRVFCHKYARYGLPTMELVEFLKEIINGRNAIEIGAGHGDLGCHLNIPMTDSKCQASPQLQLYYSAMGQPTIKYPADVEKLEALDAIKKYQPQVVIGSWVTQWLDPNKPATKGGSMYGVKEGELLKLVETYVVIGNLDSHGDKDIIDLPHEEIVLPGIRSRASNPVNNRIFIWNTKPDEQV